MIKECYLSDTEVQVVQSEYKKKYPPFAPYKLSPIETAFIGNDYVSLLFHQNGQDTDDYAMNEHHKIHRYIKHLPKDSKILFLGTGTGREVVCARDKYQLQAQGVTLGSRNVFFGQHYLGLSEEELKEGYVESLPYFANHFDAVHGYQIFEHAVSPSLFLKEANRVLKRGGELFLEWPPGKDYSMGENPHHQICYTPGQAEALLMKNGFGNIQLLQDNMSPLPEEDKWRNDQNYMLCIKGIKY